MKAYSLATPTGINAELGSAALPLALTVSTGESIRTTARWRTAS
jgi:hypothetical protein